MIRAELWTELGVYYDHWFDAENVIRVTVFWLDVLIAEGILVRRWDEDCGEHRYHHARHAPFEVLVN